MKRLALVVGAFLVLAVAAGAASQSGEADLLSQSWAKMRTASVYNKWRNQNPGEATKLEAYWANGGTAPALATAFGQALTLEAQAYWSLNAAPPPPPPPPAAACADTVDNDGDGKVDYPADPGCTDAADTDETDPVPPPPPLAACADGKDNDGDGKVDLADPGCSSSADTDETDPTPPPPPPPPATGFPDATNTGVPAGTVLHTCSTTISAPGVYDSCQFNGAVTIRSAGVTISKSLIKGQVVAPNDNLQGAVLVDTTIDCGCLSQSDTSTPVAIQYNNFTLRRVNLFHSGHGVALGSNVTIEDSYIHDLGGNTQAHKDGLYVGDGTNSVIRHNTIECNDGPAAGCTSAIGLLTDFGTVSYFTIDNNLLNTIGSYCFYAAGGPSKPYGSDHITFTNNHFGRKFRSNCGYYGPVTYWNSSKPGMVWSGNVWDDTGQPVQPAN